MATSWSNDYWRVLWDWFSSYSGTLSLFQTADLNILDNLFIGKRFMSNKKIGLISLTALVLSSMIGSGIFSLPQNMAAVAGSEALLIGWLITGIGIIFLRLSFFLSLALNLN